MDEVTLKARVRDLYPDAVIEVNGESCNYEVYVVSEAFADMRTLQRQQSVLALFAEEFKTGALHALGVKAKTPEELSEVKSSLFQISK
jgi:BolA protein